LSRVFCQSSGIGIGAAGLGEVSDPVQLLPGLMIGLCRIACISAFEKVCRSQIIEGRLHNFRPGVLVSELFRFSEDGVGGLRRFQLDLTLSVKFTG